MYRAEARKVFGGSVIDTDAEKLLDLRQRPNAYAGSQALDACTSS